MNVRGSGAVVTGGGNGIGRALARRLAAAGARVVVNDRDPAAAEAVAAETVGWAAPADVSTEAGVRDVIAAAREHVGEIEIYCSNAGVAAGTGEDSTEETWQRSWDVNVMAHVRASRQLMPGWLARGRGRFVITASAAGLLTMLGTAPYSVTKHAAVGYAEWLAATYGHRGLHVHCICPQGVRTSMLAGTGRAGGADVVYDPIGGDAYDRSARCVAFEGRILVIGFAGGRVPAPALNHALIKNYSIVGLHWGLYATKEPTAIRDCHDQLLKLAAAGAIKPLVSERIGLADVIDGLERLAAGTTIGRLTFLP